MNDLTINRPITGDISRDSHISTPQLGSAEFLAAIDAVLAVDGVLSLHWTQYTPYFNDGDACEFGTNEIFVRLDDRFVEGGEDEPEEYDEDDYIEDRRGIFSSYNLYKYKEIGERPQPYLDKNGNPTGRYVWGETNTNPASADWNTRYYAPENKVWNRNGQDTTEIGVALDSLNKQIGAFYDVLRNNFGDPADVTASSEGFSVQYYEHD